MNSSNKAKGWLLPAVLILFLLEIIFLPFATRLTYAGRSESPDHVLIYTPNKLTWNNTTNVDKDTGVAELSLFSSIYQNVKSDNNDKVIAPGSEGTSIVRLKNDSGNAISYIAVMYCEKEEYTLPVVPTMSDDAAFTDTEIYPLPEEVSREQVVRAVTGTVEANEMQDFDITWLWEYYQSDVRDQMDTFLGNTAAWEIPDEIHAGLYIVVEEDSDPDDYDPGDPYTYPQVPKTGDFSHMRFCLILMVISAFRFLLIMLDSRKEKKCGKF